MAFVRAGRGQKPHRIVVNCRGEFRNKMKPCVKTASIMRFASRGPFISDAGTIFRRSEGHFNMTFSICHRQMASASWVR